MRHLRGLLLLLLAATLPAQGVPLVTRFEVHDRSSGLPSGKVLCVLGAEGRVWAGTDHGLAVLEGGRWRTIPLGDDPARLLVDALAYDPLTGDLWAATFHGLLRISAGRVEAFTQLNSGLPNDVVYSVAVVGREVWAATAAGTGRLDLRTGAWDLFDQTNTLMHEPWCYSLASGGGRVFVGVWGGGIVEYDPSRDAWKEHRDPDGEMEMDLLPDDGPVHDVTSSVAWSDGLLWQGTYFGLSRYDGTRWRTWVAGRSPLPSNFVNFVAARGRVAWIATDDGLAATDGGTWVVYRRDPEGRGVRTVVLPDGTTRREATTTAVPHNEVMGIWAGDGEVWVATSAGLARGILGGPVPPAEAPASRRSQR
jgi:Predicted periplasmic ligand-binding sensor domain